MLNLLDAFSCCSEDLFLDNSSNLNMSYNPQPGSVSIKEELIELRLQLEELKQRHKYLKKIKPQQAKGPAEKVIKTSECL